MRAMFLGLAAVLVAAPAAASEPYLLTIDTPAARVGAATGATVKVVVSAGYHINKEYPTSLKLTAPDGVELPKAAFTARDGGVKLDEKQALVEIAYTPKQAGKKTFSGTFS